MNSGISKLLRQWAIAKKMNYNMAKRLYKKADWREKTQIKEEMITFMDKYIPSASTRPLPK